ncbi:nicotianamine synthase family protein [Methanocrinis sp.]|uniref:nicotianamine synthase family protein n=1 Tax=Methanocrinis sp. TaxID=3101522 RepID=UPI003D0CAC67
MRIEQAVADRLHLAREFSGCRLDCSHGFEVIKSHILNFYDEVRVHDKESLSTLKPEDLYALYRDLDEVAHLEVGDRLAGLILEDVEIKRALHTIRSCYSAFFDYHEIHLARDLLNSQSPWSALKSFPLYPRYRALIKNQVKAANLSLGDTLAFLGCGPLPITSILLGRIYGIGSVGLDSDPRAIEIARECVKHLHLEDRVSIVEGDESGLEGIEWDVVLVAALAEPKKRIFQEIRSVLRKRGPRKVCYRTYSGMRAVLYRPVQPGDVEGFRKVREIAPRGKVNNTIVVLELKEDGRDI